MWKRLLQANWSEAESMANIKIQRSCRLIKTEGTQTQKTLFFDIGSAGMEEPAPGQFFMLEYRGSQKPFSFSHYDARTLGITVQARGECTKRMISGKPGEYYGITGPLGRGFDCGGQNMLLIGGGVGTAPLYYLMTYMLARGSSVRALFGARTAELLEWTRPYAEHTEYYTDDGSLGTQGFVTQDLCDMLRSGRYDGCAVCGPEKMMSLAVSEIVRSGVQIKTQISVERYMKCGLGLCGSCALDDTGDRVCTEGPVFDMQSMIDSPEFGHYRRNGYGQIER